MGKANWSFGEALKTSEKIKTKNMTTPNPFGDVEKKLKKAKELQKALKNETLYVESMQEKVKQEFDADEVEKIRNKLR